jgi:hypothetical protein
MSISAELDCALAYLLRMKELAEFFNYPKEQQKRIDLIFRAACNLKKQLEKKR